MKKLLFPLLLIFGFIISLQQNILACSCSSYMSVCQAYDSAEAIFLGTVTKVSKTKMKSSWVEDLPNGKEKRENVKGWKHYIKVERTYKGTPQNEIILAIEDDYCSGIEYAVGSKLLLYAYFDKDDKFWKTDGYCGRGHSRSKEDLNYLNGLPNTLNQTLISGKLYRFEDKPIKDNKRIEPLSNKKLTVSSKTNSYNLTTDENGYYEMYSLPLDTYVITPEIPKGLKIRFKVYYGFGEFLKNLLNETNSVTVDLKETRCVGVSFSYNTEFPNN